MQLSSASPRISPNRFQRLATAPSPRIRDATRLTAPFAISSATAIRYASNTTSSPAAAAQSNAAPATPSTESSFPNLDSIVLDDLQSTSSNIPEQIGYLREVGIDYGWGPTSTIQWLMEHAHVSCGLPWWASIAATALLLRVVIFPLFVKSSDTTARTAALTSITKPLTDRMSQCQREGDSDGMRAAWAQLRAVRANAGIRLRDQFAPMLVQGVFGFCGYRLTSACANLPVPSFATGGFLHLSDLTIPDPFLILPIAMGATMHLMVRLGGESGSMSPEMQTANMRNLMLYIMPGAIVLITGWQSGAVAVWFMASGAGGLIQARLLQNESVRKYLGIAPLYKATPEETATNPTSPSTGRVIDVNATPKTGPVKPTYQAPNLNKIRNNSTKASPPPPQESAPPAAQAPKQAPKESLIEAIKNRFAGARKVGHENQAKAHEERLKKQRLQRARDYEARASGRK
ncbi:hypothetical protein MBLNU230_g0439t1 [Neophaeotheca triangularis]